MVCPCVGLIAMQQIKEVWRMQASENVDDHTTLCMIEDCVLSSTEATCLNSEPLLDFDEYNQVAL